MKLPSIGYERINLVRDLVRQCFVSRENRIGFYDAMRSYYLFGTDGWGYDADDGAFNKIYSHVQQLNSFMFSPETTRFNIDIGPSVPNEFQSYVNPMTELLHQTWHATPQSGLDETFKGALEWASVYGSTFIKMIPRVWRDKNDPSRTKLLSVRHHIVEPHNIGVLREDKYGLYNQEAYAEKYLITKSQLRNELSMHRDRDRIMKIADEMSPTSASRTQAGSGTMDRLIVTAIVGNSVEGEANMAGSPLTTLYRPQMSQDMLEMTELYVYDDEIEDWRIFVLLGDDEPIWDRPLERMFLPFTLPHIQVCPLIAHDYAYGYSRVEKIIRLQDFRNERMTDIRHLARKQAHSPTSITGSAGVPDEMADALDTPGGMLVLPDVTAQIKEHTVTVDSTQWEDITQIDQMIDDTAGLPPINQGKSQKGVRSEAQGMTLSELGATRAKSDALTIEDSLDSAATVLVRILRRYSATELRKDSDDNQQTPGEGVFTPSQFPEDFVAKVDGHSSSPVFRENYEAKVFKLLALNAIDKEEALQLLDMPRKKQLISTLKDKIEPSEAQAHKEAMDLKLASIAAKRNKGR